MNVTGDEAARYDAVRLDSYATVNLGPLTAANDETGYVAWKDKAGETKTLSLGMHAIRLVPKSAYKR